MWLAYFLLLAVLDDKIYLKMQTDLSSKKFKSQNFYTQRFLLKYKPD